MYMGMLSGKQFEHLRNRIYDRYVAISRSFCTVEMVPDMYLQKFCC